MKRRVILSLVVVAFSILTAQACGPDFFPDVFVRKLGPDNAKEFAKGKLGILRSTYPRQDLIVAYRYLNRGVLSSAEQAAYQPLESMREAMPDVLGQPASDASQESNAPDPAQSWSVVRARFVAGAAAPDPEGKRTVVFSEGGGSYETRYENCNADAFRTAMKTVEARAKTWGGKSATLVDWIHGQDAVFANCSSKELVSPGAAPAGSPALLQQDRAYQLAAANFYNGKFDDARAGFDAIGKDSASPWRGIAQYLVARCLVRKAFLSAPTNTGEGAASFDSATMREAGEVLRALLKNPPEGLSRRTIEKELDLVRLRIEPEARVHELAEALSGPAADAEYPQHLADLTIFLDGKLDSLALREDAGEEAFPSLDSKNNQPIYGTAKQKAVKFDETYRGLASIGASSPLVDWLITFQSPAKEAASHAVDRWRATQQPLWLVVAIAKAGASDNDVAELVKAAGTTETTTPQWETVTYHRIRLLIATGKAEEARAVLEKAMPQVTADGNGSSLNAFTGLRMQAAPDLNQFLNFAPRRILARLSQEQSALDECLTVMKDPKRAYDCKDDKNPMQFSDDAAGFFNGQAPLATLVDAAGSSELPAPLRRSLAMMAWVRAVLLGDDTSAAKIFPMLPAKLQQQAGSGTGFHPLVAIVRNPGLRPYLDAGVQRAYSYDFVESYADNWWCPNWDAPAFSDQDSARERFPVTFLSGAQMDQGKQQVAQLMRLGGAEVDLGSRVLAYANAHPADPDVPEALYLTLRLVRYGCEHAGYSSTAEQKSEAKRVDEVRASAAKLLRERYASSPWTKKAAPFAR